MSSRETTPSISSPPETTDTSLTESSLPDTPMIELPSLDGSSTMEETETEETTVGPDDASSFKDTNPKAKTGGKRKASSTTEGPKEKKSRAKPASKPKKESGETSRATWEPAHNSYILQAKAEGKTNKEMAEGLQSTFGIEKAPGVVTKQLSRLKAKNFDWTEELVSFLVHLTTLLTAARKLCCVRV